MITVPCVVSDSLIWNQNRFIIDLINAVPHGPVVIDLKHEGPCCQSLGLDDLLQSIPGLEVAAIRTANQISSSVFNEIRLPFVEIAKAKQKVTAVTQHTSSLGKRFAMFIGRSNWQRLALASFLWKNYRDQCALTYHYDRNIEYHQVNFGLEALLQKQWNRRQEVYEFIEQLPIKFDQQTYPILWNQAAFDLDQHYSDIFCEVVCETFFSGHTFMMTEKIMRPIAQRRPFVVQGPIYFLENLKRLGFQTFDQWWDESYDQDPSEAKFDSISWTLNFIGSQSLHTIAKWYQQMQPVLDHNAKILADLTNNQITQTLFRKN